MINRDNLPYRILGIAALIVAACLLAGAQEQGGAQEKQSVSLRDLVSRDDPLAAQDLHFDKSFAQLSIAYLQSLDWRILDQLANSPAAAHMLNHARNFDYDVPQDSPTALVSHLVTPPSKHLDKIAACQRSIAFFSGAMLNDAHWVEDSLRYLPGDFRFRGTLFLTFGYDIGVAFGPNASLNCAHPHFQEHLRELRYYAIHELHHAGFMTYHAPPKVSELKTCDDLLRLVEYSTQLEGMAVLAAYQRRREEHALADDGDYVALQDEQRMQRDTASYFEDVHYLRNCANQVADANAWAVIDRMSAGDRLWYRVGARMAQRIEQSAGRAKLIDLVKQGPASFAAAYQSVEDSASKSKTTGR
jgi:hypothetical protein